MSLFCCEPKRLPRNGKVGIDQLRFLMVVGADVARYGLGKLRRLVRL